MNKFYPLTKRAPQYHKRSLNQLFRIMKLTAFIFTIAIMQVSANVLAQKITLNEKQVSLDKIFRKIRLQSGYDFLTDNGLVEKAGQVTINVKNADLKDVLNIILRPPLTYEIVNKTVVIKQQPGSFFDRLKDKTSKLLASPSDVKGTVVDSTGKALAGASVALKGTGFYTTTGSKGEFWFAAVPDGNYTLIVKYIGYASLEKTITTGDKDISLKLVLSQSVSALDQVQVIAYGTESKRFSVGSVSSVSAKDIEKQPITNPLLALQGQVPGLAVNASSGVPGSTVLLQIRGQNTLAYNPGAVKPYDQPLFIIDGVPFAPQNNNVSQINSLANKSDYTGGIDQAVGISPFNTINPKDIESISILRDADATSIYGTQGSNGVVIITTKKGKPGKSNFDISINTGFNTPVRPVQLLNTQQYLQFRSDAFKADNATPGNDPDNTDTYAPDLTIFEKNKYTDWQKVIYGKTSNITNVHSSISGGSANNTFLISAGYNRSNYDFPGNYANQTATLHSSLHHVSSNNRFSIDLTNDYGYGQNNSPGSVTQILLPPNLPDLLDSKGNLVWSYKGADLSDYQFYSYLKQSVNVQNYNLNNSLRLSYKILNGLTFSANLGYSRNTTSEHSENPVTAQSPLDERSSSAAFANGVQQSINIEPQLDYTKTMGKSVLTALIGATYKKNTGNNNTIQGYGYANDDLLGSINGASRISATDNSSIYKYSAGFARLKYVYAQKYIISLTGRRDGSSNFGPGRQFGDFGSIGAGWIFSEEAAFKKALPFISYAKLSGSYGTSGSDGILPYQFQAFWQPIVSVSNFQGVRPGYPTNLYNPDYTWALKKSLNLALDLGLFNDRLMLNGTYYRNREGNQLANYPLPIHTGFSNVLENLTANIQNKGWEFSATAENIKTKNFTWTSSFNISFNRNKLLAFPGLAASSYASKYMIGQPTSIVFGYRYKDVNPTTGLFEFYDKDGQLTSNPKFGLATDGGDMVEMANREVNYMGGINNNFSYKHFSLYFLFQFSSQMAPNYLSVAYGSGAIGISPVNVPSAILDNYWKKPGDQALLQRLSSSYSSDALVSANAFTQSTGIYSNDTYLRLKTMSLSYALPDGLLKKLHMKGCSIYVSAENLLTITNYKVGDPELTDYSTFPLQRVVAFGLNLNF